MDSGADPPGGLVDPYELAERMRRAIEAEALVANAQWRLADDQRQNEVRAQRTAEFDRCLDWLHGQAPVAVRESLRGRTWDEGGTIESRVAYLRVLVREWGAHVAQPITPTPVVTQTVIQPIALANAERVMAYATGLYHEEVERRRALEQEQTGMRAERDQWRQRAVEAEAIVANYRRQLVDVATTLRGLGTAASEVIRDDARLADFLQRVQGLQGTIDAHVVAPNARPPLPAPNRINAYQYARAQVVGVGIAPHYDFGPARAAPPEPPSVRPDGRDPDVVARELLVDCLTTAQRAEFESNGTFTVEVTMGEYAGHRYRIEQREQGGVYHLRRRGNSWGEDGTYYCIVPTGDSPPIFDHMLTEKLLLESDPALFFATANRL